MIDRLGDLGALGGSKLLRRGSRFRRLPGAEFAVEVQQRGRIVTDELELVYDLARRLFLFDLFLDEPLEFHQRGELLLVERQFPQAVDLLRDHLFLSERLLEDL